MRAGVLVACMMAAGVARAAPGTTPVRITVDPTITCPAADELATALGRRLPPELSLRDGPDHLDFDVEALGVDRLRVSLTDGTAEIERVLPVDPRDCAAVADTVALLAASWIAGHAWWGAVPAAADDDAAEGPLAPREAPMPPPAVVPPPAIGPAPRPRFEAAPEATLVRQAAPVHQPFGLRLGARVAFASSEQRLLSNGTLPGSNYAGSTWLEGAFTSVAYTHALGRHFNLGIDTSFGVVTGSYSGVLQAGPSSTRSMLFDVGAGAGVHLAALGGLQARARVGFAVQQNTIDLQCCVALFPQDPPIPSDQVLGLVTGVEVELPSLVHIGSRALALRLSGGAVAPATRQQTTGLSQGAIETTYGARAGAALLFELYRGLALEATYDYAGYFTHYSGTGQRDNTSTVADLSTSTHVLGVGLAYVLRPR